MTRVAHKTTGNSRALAGAVAAYGLPIKATLAVYRAAHSDTSAGEEADRHYLSMLRSFCRPGWE
jgi:hypothetical protein